MSSNRNRTAGLNWERELVNRFNSLGYTSEDKFINLFPLVGTTRDLSRAMDAMKIDITTKDPLEHKNFGLTIQAKNTTTAVSYPKLLASMEEGVSRYKGIPIIFHKQTKRVNNKFMKCGEYVILKANDFEGIYSKLAIYKLAYTELMSYYDSFNEDIQKEINIYLSNLNL